MSELDWMEREERYRTRLTRMLVLLSLLAAAFFGTGFWLLDRQKKATELAEAEAAQAALVAEAAAARAAYSADSTAAVQRLTDFQSNYTIEVLEGAPVLMAKIPRGRGVTGFLESVWSEYVRAVEPNADDERKRLLFRVHYVDVMNRAWYNSRGRLSWEGDNPPTHVLLPDTRQRGKDFEFEKPSFAQIVRGQEAAGIRIIEEQEFDPDAIPEETGDSEITQNTGGEEPATPESNQP